MHPSKEWGPSKEGLGPCQSVSLVSLMPDFQRMSTVLGDRMCRETSGSVTDLLGDLGQVCASLQASPLAHGSIEGDEPSDPQLGVSAVRDQGCFHQHRSFGICHTAWHIVGSFKKDERGG